MTKVTIALATALLLGVASAACAGSRDDADSSGGYRVGPLGNPAASGVNPVDHPSLRGPYGYGYGYDYVPPARPRARRHRAR